MNIVFLCEMVGCTIIICFLEFGVLVVGTRKRKEKKKKIISRIYVEED